MKSGQHEQPELIFYEKTTTTPIDENKPTYAHLTWEGSASRVESDRNLYLLMARRREKVRTYDDVQSHKEAYGKRNQYYDQFGILLNHMDIMTPAEQA